MTNLYIGLMSGTSVDAIDAVLVEFADNTPALLAQSVSAYPEKLRAELLALTRPGDNELNRMATLDNSVARAFAGAVRELLREVNVAPQRVHAIGSHGQTVRHMPTGAEPYTVQIGNPSLIAELTGIATVADFRRRDVAAGGQGAPLAPAFHAAFLRDADENRVVVNIGGIANITLFPADSALPASGFDTGPGNVLMDAWAQRHLDVPLDHNGRWGEQGRVLSELLSALLADDYFALPPPKSTGREHFHLPWLEAALADLGDAAPQDVQATLTVLTAQSIANAVRCYAPATQRVLVCGGGVHNRLLMQRLQEQLPEMAVESTATQGVDPDYMEALGFAWLAKRTLEGKPGNLPEVTGAKGLRILGGIYPA